MSRKRSIAKSNVESNHPTSKKAKKMNLLFKISQHKLESGFVALEVKQSQRNESNSPYRFRCQYINQDSEDKYFTFYHYASRITAQQYLFRINQSQIDYSLKFQIVGDDDNSQYSNILQCTVPTSIIHSRDYKIGDIVMADDDNSGAFGKVTITDQSADGLLWTVKLNPYLPREPASYVTEDKLRRLEKAYFFDTCDSLAMDRALFLSNTESHSEGVYVTVRDSMSTIALHLMQWDRWTNGNIESLQIGRHLSNLIVGYVFPKEFDWIMSCSRCSMTDDRRSTLRLKSFANWHSFRSRHICDDCGARLQNWEMIYVCEGEHEYCTHCANVSVIRFNRISEAMHSKLNSQLNDDCISEIVSFVVGIAKQKHNRV